MSTYGGQRHDHGFEGALRRLAAIRILDVVSDELVWAGKDNLRAQDAE